jgi:hypothetical protein
MTDPRRRRKRAPVVEIRADSQAVVPAPPKNGEIVPTDSIENQIATRMNEAHPIYGAFGHVFREMGGVDRLQEWAEDEPGKFYAIFAKMVPQDSTNNQINIQINAKLAPGPLDE